MFIQCENLVKIYKVADLEVLALQGLDLSIEQGEMVGIVGTSGSGKSTFLNVVGGLDRPSAGKMIVNGRDLLKMSTRDLETYRRHEVGFIWQQSARNLVPYLTAWDNIQLPMTIAGASFREKREWTAELLNAVGLWEHRKHKLAQLSGGQQQRVAIGVALANRPQLLLGDEPTGELDSATADEIMDLFQKLNEELGLTTIIVTHDPQIAKMVDRVITIRDGRMSSETVRRNAQGRRRAGQDSGLAQDEATLIENEINNSDHGDQFEELVVVDGVGRLQIPPELRDQIGASGRVVIKVADDGSLNIRPIDSS
ncbi:MAG: ATP-binding cassette domain-containing protein [Anaerolineae bacterium]